MGFYFEKHRSLAMGFAVSGVGIGTFIFPPIITHLIETYGIKGAMLIIGGIILNVVVIGALYLPWKGDRNIIADITNDELNIGASGAIKNEHEQGIGSTLHQKHKESYLSIGKTVRECDLQLVLNSKPGSTYGSNPSLLSNGTLHASGSIFDNISYTNGSIYFQEDCIKDLSMHNEQEKRLKLTLYEKFNIDIFLQFSYLSICLNNLLFCFGLSIVYVHLGSYAKETLYLTIEQSSYFFSAIGIANFFGR